MSVPFKWLARTDSDLQQFKACFDENNSPRTVEHLRWQYFDGCQTLEPLVALGLADPERKDGSLSGIYSVFQNEFICSGSKVLGTQSLDTLTSAPFRGKGLFNALANIVYKQSEDKGVGFVYGFPNGNSAHGFFGKLGWHKLDPIPFLIKPIRLRYIAGKLPGIKKLANYFPDVRFSPRRKKPKEGFRLVADVPYGDDYDTLWAGFCEKINVAIDRSSSYMNWRLVEKPGEEYRNIACYGPAGDMQALCVFVVKDKHGGRVGYVMELLHGNGCEEQAELVLGNALAEMASVGSDAVLAWNFDHSPNNSTFKSSGFYVLPERLRPIELHFGCRAFDGALSNILNNRTNWYLSYLDSDTV